MKLVDLNVRNMSYYAFHPHSKALSPQDQKIALAVTVLMALFTGGLGHLVCGIVYGINKTGIDSSHLAALTDDVASTRLKNKEAQAIFEQIQNKLEACHDVVKPFYDLCDHVGIRIQGNIVEKVINKLCKITVAENMNLDSLLDDFKQELLKEIKLTLATTPPSYYDFSIEIVHAKVVEEGGEKLNRYLVVDGSVQKTNAGVFKTQGPGHLATRVLPAKYNALRPAHSEGVDRDILEGLVF